MIDKIFISYSRKDEAFARQLAVSLSHAGAYVWLDVKDIPAGMNWSSAIQQGLDEADLMILAVSPDSMASTNVENEWQYFLDQKKPIIPVLYKAAKLHFQLSRAQYVDFVNQPYDTAFNNLLEELKTKGFRSLTGIKPPASPPVRTVDWTKRGVIVALVVGLLAVVATLAQPFIASQLQNTPVSAPTSTIAQTEPSIPPTHTPISPTPTASPEIQLTPPPAGESAAAHLSLIWDENSLVLLVNGTTDLNNVLLVTNSGSNVERQQSLTQAFPILGVQNFVVDEVGTCLRFYPSDKKPVLPLTCTGKLFDLELAQSDVFWYDVRTNRLRDVIIRRGETTLGICPAGSGKCNIDT